MTTRFLTGVSLLVNLALIALVALALRSGRAPAGGEVTSGSKTPAAVSAAVGLKTNLTRIELTQTNEAPPFHWRAVQSGDFKQYAANLRAIGCPEETLRAVIESELWERFLPRRRALLEPFHSRFWDVTAATGVNLRDSVEPFTESVDKLKEETIEKLDEFVGKEAPEVSSTPWRNPEFDFLSEEKQRQLQELQQRLDADQRQLLEGRGNPGSQLKALREELQVRREAGIRDAMTPEEFAEYTLRRSQFARTANSSAGFEATPDEARVLARIYGQFEAAEYPARSKDPDAAVKRAQAELVKQQRDEAAKETLGAGRFAEFQQGLDGTFADIYRITKRYELPRETAARAAETLKAREAALARLTADSSLSAQEREERTLAIQLETRTTMLGVLGPRALRTYEKYEGPIIPEPEQAAEK